MTPAIAVAVVYVGVALDIMCTAAYVRIFLKRRSEHRWGLNSPNPLAYLDESDPNVRSVHKELCIRKNLWVLLWIAAVLWLART